jgi:hypothetical protein
MLKIMSLKKRIIQARKEREKQQGRLKGTREPTMSSGEVLERHPNDPLVLIKFRETESLKEKSILVPMGVHLKELQKQACVFFNYPQEKYMGVKLGYPNDGIERYDQEGDSILRNLDSDTTVQEVTELCSNYVHFFRCFILSCKHSLMFPFLLFFFPHVVLILPKL